MGEDKKIAEKVTGGIGGATGAAELGVGIVKFVKKAKKQKK